MDITVLLIREIEGALGVPCHPTVPADRPERFVTVERTGGTRGAFLNKPNVAIQSWAPTEQEASELADEVDAVMEALPYGSSGVTKVDRGEPYPFPSIEKIPRYQALYSLVTHRKLTHKEA